MNQRYVTSFEPTRDIENASLVTDVFGEWPTFHDAEILLIRLDRGRGVPSLQAVIHVFKMTNETDSSGVYACINHVLVTLSFHNIDLHELKWFNQQNSIDGLEIGPSDDGGRRLSVYFPSNNGCDAQFDCDRIEVVNVEPYTKEARTLDKSVYA